MDHNKILGVVLAGGKSQRFGQDKSQVKLQGKILIDYILSEIVDEFNETLIVTNNLINFMSSDKIFLTKDFKNVEQDFEVINFFSDEIKKEDLSRIFIESSTPNIFRCSFIKS